LLTLSKHIIYIYPIPGIPVHALHLTISAGKPAFTAHTKPNVPGFLK